MSENEEILAALNNLNGKQDEQMELLTEIRIQNAKLDGRMDTIESKLTGKIAVLTEKVASHAKQLDWNWRVWLGFVGAIGSAVGVWKLIE
ncbi:MAG: hypothetical protein A3G34_10475 [Candidatus Lindowbacteria bacterium RIFCSPLOWO2_12_FULL_62_27]|nr:MAG: hypothetical protein A3G34_10475 [Candidatus Lindowbacteria bacterium RIFCSPLOWO2_12_FULL_62_27]